jgi:chromatin remodeling complex protein RSC6
MAKKAKTKKTATKKKAAKKTTKASARKTTTAKKTAKPKTKRKPNPAFMKPLTIGEPLQPIVGAKPMPRTEVVKRLWDYIRKNGLQDTKEKRNINADENLQRVFGGKKQVSMFEMTKYVSKYLS